MTAWYLYPLLLDPAGVERSLDRIRAAGLVEPVPNAWQIALGVLRMQHRLLFRSDTIGTCRTNPVRPTLRARLLHARVVRFPFLLAERAIAPLDLSGLLSSPERVIAHLLGAHHDENQFAYDLQMLAVRPGMHERLHEAERAIVEHDTSRARWLRDLCVFEGYHESLLAAVERALRGDFALPPHEAEDPDVSFVAYLRWCAAQPATPAETLEELRRGAFSIARGRVEATC